MLIEMFNFLRHKSSVYRSKSSQKNAENRDSVFITLSEYEQTTTPFKRKRKETLMKSKRPHLAYYTEDSESSFDGYPKKSEASLLPAPLKLEKLSRVYDVRFHTDRSSTDNFKCVFEYLLPKVRNM